MTDSAIAVATFGSGKAVLATDYSAGAHSPKVTTNGASDGIAISGFGGGKHVVGTVKSGGVHTLCVTTGAANDAIALPGARGEKVVIGTVLSGGVHTIAVTTGAANSSVAIAGFGSDIIRLATVLNAGVHTLAVSTSGNGGFAIAGFGADKTVFASAGAGGTHSVTVNGLNSYVGPLDYRPGAVGVAGTIKFYSSYAGKALRVRNPDTNVESDIDFTADGVLNSSQIAAAKGASTTLPVTKLYAQDGSGNDYVQATPGNQPVLAPSGPGSHWAVVFDGINDFISAPLIQAQPFTRYFIINPFTWVSNAYVFDGGGTFGWNNGAFTAGGGTQNYLLSAGAFGCVQTFAAGTWHIGTNVFNGAASENRRNRNVASNGSAGTAILRENHYIGARPSIGDFNANIGLIGVLIYPVADGTAAQDVAILSLGNAAGIAV